MPSGPTQEGSITAYVRAETAQFKSDMAEAQAEIDRVAHSDPTVKVHADTGEAMAGLAAVKAEQDAINEGFRNYMQDQRGSAPMSGLERLQRQIGGFNSTLPESFAVNDLTKAEQRLTQAKRDMTAADRDLVSTTGILNGLMDSGSNDVIKIVGAFNKAQEAMSAYEAAEKRLVDAQGVADQFAGDGGTTGGKTPPPNNGRAAGPAAAIAIGVAAAVPMVADLAAYLAAVSGAFIGMGAAGVLAVKGITSEMASGSAEGRVYSSLMQTLQGDLGTLEQTAAHGVLTGFEASVQGIDNQMPSLNSEVDGLSRGLGQLAGITIDGLAVGFKEVNPLINEAQSYIIGLANEWDTWIHSGGLSQWASDAERVFPLVANTVGTLGQSILGLIGDLQPLGTVMIGIVDVAAHVIDFISQMGPAFGPVALAGVTAFLIIQKNWSTISPIFAAAGQAVLAFAAGEDVATTATTALAVAQKAVPVLALAGALAGLVAIVTAVAQGVGQAATATADFSGAIQQDSGVIGDNTQKQLAQTLAQDGAVTSAKQLGLTTQQVTTAIVAGGAAKDKLIAQLNAITAAHTKAIGTGRSYRVVTDETGQSSSKLAGIIGDVNKSLDSSIAQYKLQNTASAALALQAQNNITKNGQLTLSYGLTSAQIANNANEQDNLATQTAWVSLQLNLENTAATNLQNQLTLLDNGTLSLAQAQTAAAAATLNVTGTLKKNHDALNLTTAAGIADRQAIEQKVQADQAAAAAITKSTGSQDAGTASLLKSRDALEEQLKKLGLLTPAVKAYIEQIDQIPKETWTTIGVNMKGAMSALSQFNTALSNSVPGGVTRVGNAHAHADGGPIYRAAGGWAAFIPRGTDTVPAMLTPGEFVVKDKSAAYNPQFLKAYNADPAAALASVSHTSGTHVEQHFTNIMQPGTSPAQFARELAWQGRNTGMRR